MQELGAEGSRTGVGGVQERGCSRVGEGGLQALGKGCRHWAEGCRCGSGGSRSGGRKAAGVGWEVGGGRSGASRRGVDIMRVMLRRPRLKGFML